MNTRRCYKIADRIHAGLQRELGEGIDRERMVHHALYARDVLLVCEALRASDMPDLARAFRRAVSAPEPVLAVPAAAASGFSASRFISSLFGTPSTLDSRPASDAPPPAARRSGWFGRLGIGAGDSAGNSAGSGKP
ncbi:hypothetical protein [Rubrivivax sp. A210]|uniref:hypothetical protein n=1 Tax=Rubrivivax sp. A210 TaxID=2772301 RepID=UPI001919A5D6|nr:hypothetical protein [Rubrivivax sp. A210]